MPSSQLIPTDLSCCQLTDTGIVFDGDVSFEQWLGVGKQLKVYGKAVHWWIGDWLAYGEGRKAEWGNKYDEAVKATGFAYQTLRNDKAVAKAIPLSLRKDKLTYSHHALVVKLPTNARTEWLDKAEAGGWACAKLRKAIKGELEDERKKDDSAGTDLSKAVELAERAILALSQIPIDDPRRAEAMSMVSRWVRKNR